MKVLEFNGNNKKGMEERNSHYGFVLIMCFFASKGVLHKIFVIKNFLPNSISITSLGLCTQNNKRGVKKSSEQVKLKGSLKVFLQCCRI